MNQKFWEEHLEDTKALRDAAQKRLNELELALSIVEGRVREASRWKLYGANWGDPGEVSWEELMAYVPKQANAGKKKVTMTITLDRIEWATGRRSTDRLAIARRITEEDKNR